MFHSLQQQQRQQQQHGRTEENSVVKAATSMTPSRRPFQSLHVNVDAASRTPRPADHQDKMPTKVHQPFYSAQPQALVVATDETAVRDDDDESSTMSNHREAFKPSLNMALEEARPSIFRATDNTDANDDGMDDMWTLKRANAVVDDDDAESVAYESPTKRQCQELYWDECCVNTTDEPFQLVYNDSLRS